VVGLQLACLAALARGGARARPAASLAQATIASLFSAASARTDLGSCGLLRDDVVELPIATPSTGGAIPLLQHVGEARVAAPLTRHGRRAAADWTSNGAR